MNRLLLITLTVISLTSFGQTSIDERKLFMEIRNEIACYSIVCEFKIPYLAGVTQDDVRVQINDSLSKIVKELIESGNESNDFDYNDRFCDTSGIDFNPETLSLDYHIWQNSDRLLSINVSSGWGAGGGGVGFGSTEYFFNVDIFNNEIITIDSLFNSKNKILLQKYVNKNIKRLTKEQDLTNIIEDSLDVFGEAGEELSSYQYIGFNIDSTSLVFTYGVYRGRGNWSFNFQLPLKEIQTFTNKKYYWIYSEKKNRN